MKYYMMRFIEKHPVAFMLVLYAVLTIVYTFPLIMNFGSEIPQGGSDLYQGLATIRTQVETAQSLGGGLDSVWYLVKNGGTFLWFSLASLAFGLTVGYNIIFLLIFFVSAIGMYCLAWHFTRNRIGSLLAGAVFALTPFHIYQSTAVHFGVMQQQWLPWFILFFARFLEKRQWQDYLLFALFFVLVAITEHQMLAFSLLFLLVFFGIRCFQDRGLLTDRKLLVYFFVSTILLALLAFSIFGELIRVATSGQNFLDPGINAAEKYSMPLLAPLVPPELSLLWSPLNGLLSNLLSIDSKSRVEYFLGVALMTSITWLMYHLWHRRKQGDVEYAQRDRLIWLWFWLFVIFWVLALGPSIDIGSFTLYLPYFLVYKFLPFYENIRVTGRLFLFSLLSFSVLAGYAMTRLEATLHIDARRRRRIIAAVFIVTFLEFCPIPLALMRVEYSPFYDKISQESGDFKLLEIPGSTDYGFASYKLMTTTVHGKQSLDGMPLARKIKDQFDMQNGTPVIKQLLYSIPKGRDVVANPPEDAIGQNYFDQATDILNFYDVRYITLSKIYTDSETFANEEKFIKKYVCSDDRYEDRFLVAYKVCVQTPKSLFLRFDTENEQWWSLTNKDKETGLVFRAVGDGAMLEIHNLSSEIQLAKISIRFFSTAARKISLHTITGDTLLERTLIPKQSSEIDNFTLPVSYGVTKIIFSVKDNNGQPVKVNGKKNKDQAPLVNGVMVEVAR